VLRGLQDAGVQIRRFEVVASDQPERDFGRGQLPQDAGPQQHGSGQQRDHHPEPSQASWSPGGTYHSTGTEEVASLNPSVNTAQGRIDMLV
jgi:hypothetical protein